AAKLSRSARIYLFWATISTIILSRVNCFRQKFPPLRLLFPSATLPILSNPTSVVGGSGRRVVLGAGDHFGRFSSSIGPASTYVHSTGHSFAKSAPMVRRAVLPC